jgi:hypothetical protein
MQAFCRAKIGRFCMQYFYYLAAVFLILFFIRSVQSAGSADHHTCHKPGVMGKSILMMVFQG